MLLDKPTQETPKMVKSAIFSRHIKASGGVAAIPDQAFQQGVPGDDVGRDLPAKVLEDLHGLLAIALLAGVQDRRIVHHLGLSVKMVSFAEFVTC